MVSEIVMVGMSAKNVVVRNILACAEMLPSAQIANVTTWHPPKIAHTTHVRPNNNISYFETRNLPNGLLDVKPCQLDVRWITAIPKLGLIYQLVLKLSKYLVKSQVTSSSIKRS